jgi:acetyltransferase-like isoleucine patch superfamily enzyme
VRSGPSVGAASEEVDSPNCVAKGLNQVTSTKPRVQYGLTRACGALVAHTLRATIRGARALISQRRICVGHGTKIAWDVHCSSTGQVVLADNVFIASNTMIRCGLGARIEVGSHTRVGRNCILQAAPGQILSIGECVEIGDHVLMSSIAGITIGDDSRVQNHVEVGPQEDIGRGRLKAGRRVFISDHSKLDLCADITIEDEVAISPFCSIYTHNHTAIAGTLIWNNEKKFAPIRIGYGTWIGHGASIMPGVEIGRNSIIGALSVVTKSVGAETVVGGVPAKIIRYIADQNISSVAKKVPSE